MVMFLALFPPCASLRSRSASSSALKRADASSRALADVVPNAELICALNCSIVGRADLPSASA